MRNVRVATISIDRGDGVEANLSKALSMIDRVAKSNPDIIALPETCINRSATAEPVPGPITQAISEKAREYHCYVIIPLIKKEDDGKLYNVAVLLNPSGEVVGEYKKMFPTDYEMEVGIVPGSETPCFDTSFGRIGMAICFDLNFPEVIRGLADNGVEIVFFLSAYEGGRQLESWAFDYSVYVVSAHKGGSGYFVDKSGMVLQKTDREYRPIAVRELNLDREILHIDYNIRKLEQVIAEYGSAVHVDLYRPEGVFALESRSPDVSVPDIMKQFGLETFRKYMIRSRRLRMDKLAGKSVSSGPV